MVNGILIARSFILRKMQESAIYVYDDEGVAENSLEQTLLTLKGKLGKRFRISTIKANEVLGGKWTENAALFVMPGGMDLPYVKKLNGLGNKIIKKFVFNGGSYLGLCAGAYYASNYCEFDKGGNLEVLGSRELAFFPEKCVGPILANYSYEDLRGVRAALTDIYLKNHLQMKLYYNGGGYFRNAEKCEGVTVIANYKTENLAAIVNIKCGKGNVVLSGLHFEVDPYLLDLSDPYLSEIAPELIKYNNLRQDLLQNIFEVFHL